MKDQHTGGPWVVNDGLIRQQDMIDCLFLDLEAPERHWAAVGVEDAEGYAESVAYCHPDNANLVAAAPSMLAALRLARDDLQLISDEQGGSHGRTMNIILEAIAKATLP